VIDALDRTGADPHDRLFGEVPMRARAVTALAGSVGLLVPGPVPAQGIADVAKREKTRLEQSKQPPRVYNNDSFGAAGPSEAAQKPPVGGSKAVADAPAAPAAAAPAGASAAPSTAGASAAPSPGGEAYWRGRAAAARAAVDGARARVEQLEAEAARDRASPSEVSSGPCGQAGEGAKSAGRSPASGGCDESARVRRARELAASIEDARKQLDAARDAQDALRGAAHRAGARADWLR